CILAPLLHHRGLPKRDGAEDLPQEARRAAPRFNEHELEVRSQAGDHRAREAAATSYVDDDPPRGHQRYGHQGIHDVLRYYDGGIAISDQPRPLVPEIEDPQEHIEAPKAVGAEIHAYAPGGGLEELRLLSRHREQPLARRAGTPKRPTQSAARGWPAFGRAPPRARSTGRISILRNCPSPWLRVSMAGSLW